ncbi:hypothetical protein TGAMA5MH_10033 [Trichoderma gamsii]|uniref:Uncharacterized protein n=1 Tax=Trichoderma gamsii TaxID=398673 RepID=A0A2K0SXE2_9HYPO|nr:hypothetical protein TGAMA5MH_10033 [Trichoderma gamsii]
MSSQPPSLAAAAMPVVATASTSASASASASSTSPQIPSPSSSPHSSSSSDTVTCAPSASSPSPGTASAHDSHHRAKGLERLVLNAPCVTAIHASKLLAFRDTHQLVLDGTLIHSWHGEAPPLRSGPYRFIHTLHLLRLQLTSHVSITSFH